MSCDKETYSKGQKYAAFSHATTLKNLHIVNYAREQIIHSDTAGEEMERLRCSTLLPEPVSMMHTIDHNKNLSIKHHNLANL